jgi:PDZ domain
MNLHSLIPAVLLGMAVLVQAQPVTISPASKAGVAKDPNMNADGSVTLSSGTLAGVVAEIEQRMRHWTTTEGGGEPVMPNILYGTDAYNAEMPGNLRLRGVSPLQAVALAAAAADCTLEPIFAPMESLDVPLGKAIGYRIVRASPLDRRTSQGAEQLAELGQELAAMRASYTDTHPKVIALRERIRQLQVEGKVEANAVSGVGLALAKTNGSIVVGQIVPGSPAASTPSIKPGQRILRVAEGDQEAVDITGLGLEKVVQLIRGAPGTVVKLTLRGDSDKGPTEKVVTLVRSSIPITPLSGSSAAPNVKVMDPLADSFDASGGGESGMTSGGASSRMNSGFSNRRVSSVQAARGNEPFVRVYAIGFIMTGTDQEKGTKVKAVDELIRSALEDASLDPKPNLNIHQTTGTLIVRATAVQQEIIEQVVKAMKENVTQITTPAKP